MAAPLCVVRHKGAFAAYKPPCSNGAQNKKLRAQNEHGAFLRDDFEHGSVIHNLHNRFCHRKSSFLYVGFVNKAFDLGGI